ncbi:MAG TPA: SMI1/KNR4 family protein [Polyangiaceae bacterium]|nr:SMI1/KNR4 family protein [Polyangiaceae bacterium]
MASTHFVPRARALLAQLEQADQSYGLFGARAHRYRLNPCVEEAALARRERELGVRLPEAYRQFLTELGNGGAGPSYGVFAFEGGESEDYTKYERLAHPFAYTEEYNPTWLLDEDEDEGTEEEEDSSEDEDDPRHRYWEAFDDRGALYICHHGCGGRSFLVVSGRAAGQVWCDGVADDGGYSPELDASGAPFTFDTWYLDWLERALASLAGPR